MNSKENEDFQTVYSSEHGRMCPLCGNAKSQCKCRSKKVSPKGDGIVRVGRESKGRKGKGVTLITGLPLDDDGLRKLAKLFKQKCGTGGTLKNGVIEIQGEHREFLIEELKTQGFNVKRSGG
ncbi:MAG: translation initiation factor Sui1 [SAR324 cluster bacterium]|nr:translation initiation factor Sui1 [SAR324 cluster bacterium]